MYISTKKLLLERMKARDLPEELLEDEEVVAQKLKEQADAAAAAASQQGQMIQSEIRKNIANAFKDFALAIKAQTGANVDTFNAIVEGIANGDAKGGGAGASKAGASSGAS
jgi:cell pole-organizing protein PopZ